MAATKSADIAQSKPLASAIWVLYMLRGVSGALADISSGQAETKKRNDCFHVLSQFVLDEGGNES